MADDLETLTALIKSRLGEQNQILKNCVQKYQDSQGERADIAKNIQRITDELTKATNNLQTIEQQQNDFRTEKAKKEETYIRERGVMESQFKEEKAKIEEEKKGQLEAAKRHEAEVAARITQEQEQLRKKALEEEDFSADIYKWTKIINDNSDEKLKLNIFRLVCKVINADGNIDPFESNFTRRLSGLLYITDKQSGEIRKEFNS